MSQVTKGGRVPDDIVVLVKHVTSPLGEKSIELARQAAAAMIVRWSPTMLDMAVPPDTPGVFLEDGPVPGEALVYDSDDQLIGELLVWVRAGRLIGMEQAWYTDDPPSTWPKPSQVRVR